MCPSILFIINRKTESQTGSVIKSTYTAHQKERNVLSCSNSKKTSSPALLHEDQWQDDGHSIVGLHSQRTPSLVRLSQVHHPQSTDDRAALYASLLNVTIILCKKFSMDFYHLLNMLTYSSHQQLPHCTFFFCINSDLSISFTFKLHILYFYSVLQPFQSSC